MKSLAKWIELSGVFLWACRNEDSGQFQSQTEEEPITEEDLELIKERETNIRQLEVKIVVIACQSKQPVYRQQLLKYSDHLKIQSCVSAVTTVLSLVW